MNRSHPSIYLFKGMVMVLFNYFSVEIIETWYLFLKKELEDICQGNDITGLGV